ncbi:MAG: hypothetical protein JOZ33_05135, partial [Acidobacteriaceae bacterium]|nr:hypothetical protein [Acidobacteriaceae bacterium]
MQKKNAGNIVLVGLVLLNVLLWVIFGPHNDGSRPNFNRQLIAEIIASTAVVLLACALFLSTRLRSLEAYFGGLDQMYQTHKKAAMLAIFLLIFHFFAA